MAHSRRRHQSASGGNIFSKDPFGTIWLALVFLVMLIGKWFVLSPGDPQDSNCVGCVVAVLWIMAILVSALMSLFWILWIQKFEKGTSFVFFLSIFSVVSAVIYYEFAVFVMGKLFYGGSLNWQESQASFLLDEFVPHSVGLFLVSMVLYSAVRMLFCRDLVDKPLVYSFSAILIVAVAPITYLGLWLY